MNNRRNNRHQRRGFPRKTLIFSLILFVMFVIGRWVLIPWALQKYQPIQEKYKVAYLILENQQNIHHKLLALLVYTDSDGNQHSKVIELPGNSAKLAAAYLNLPGFELPGEHSGIKLVAIDNQNINTAITANDPAALSNNAIQLDGGAGRFFNFASTTPLPLVTAKLSTRSIGPIIGSKPQCYNIYAVTSPDFTLIPEQVTKNCTTPPQFTQPIS